jgi:hypothetical protein
MTRARPRPLYLLLGLLLVVGVPLAGKWSRRAAAPRCALDGRTIEAAYRARVAGPDGDERLFCCAGCARQWVARHGHGLAAVYVTDEARGGEIDARSAHFVRSAVVTNPTTGDRTHAFASRADAEEHARAFGGWLMTGPERPFPERPEGGGG